MNTNLLSIIRLAAAGGVLNLQDRMELILFLEEQGKSGKLQSGKHLIAKYEVNWETYRKIQEYAEKYNHGHYAKQNNNCFVVSPKIEAIKLLRNETGIGLKEAKEAVEFFDPKFCPNSNE